MPSDSWEQRKEIKDTRDKEEAMRERVPART